MVFVVPETTSEDVFEFEVRGKRYELPKMSSVTFDQISLLEGLSDANGLRVLFEALSPDFAREQLGALAPGQLAPLITAWQADSGIAVGESSASPSS